MKTAIQTIENTISKTKFITFLERDDTISDSEIDRFSTLTSLEIVKTLVEYEKYLHVLKSMIKSLNYKNVLTPDLRMELWEILWLDTYKKAILETLIWNYDVAYSLYKRVPQSHHNYLYAQYNIAWHIAMQWKISEAREIYNQLIDENENFDWGTRCKYNLLSLAISDSIKTPNEISKRNAKKAYDFLLEDLKSNNEEWKLYIFKWIFTLAWLELEQELYDEALKKYLQLIDSWKHILKSKFNIWTIKFKQFKLWEAKEIFEEFINCNDNSIKVAAIDMLQSIKRKIATSN